MFGPLTATRNPLLFYAFRRPESQALCSCLEVFEEALCLWDLTWTGWETREVPLDHVADLQWAGPVRLLLHLRDGEVIRMDFSSDAMRAKSEIESHLAVPGRGETELEVSLGEETAPRPSESRAPLNAPANQPPQ